LCHETFQTDWPTLGAFGILWDILGKFFDFFENLDFFMQMMYNLTLTLGAFGIFLRKSSLSPPAHISSYVHVERLNHILKRNVLKIRLFFKEDAVFSNLL